ncbi:hypothetical protein G6F35_004622 [Rhizopus arrhizus]|nr:hypothetical protein G6F35_004622 [Rhizopus arrhizus]
MKEQTMKIFLALWYAMKALARLAMIGMAMAVLGSGSAHAAPAPGKVQVEVVGKGRPLLMIPGLNSSAEVWRETCLALKDVQCHLVQLPGFAGTAPADPRPAGGGWPQPGWPAGVADGAGRAEGGQRAGGGGRAAVPAGGTRPECHRGQRAADGRAAAQGHARRRRRAMAGAAEGRSAGHDP